MSDQIEPAKALLSANGFVVLREKSYRQAQERQRVAEALREAADRAREAHYEWMRRDIFPEERRLRDRCTFLYGRGPSARSQRRRTTRPRPFPFYVRRRHRWLIESRH